MALLSSLLLPISAVRRHPSPISTTLPPWKLGLNPTTNYAVRFLCSPLVPPVLLGQRVSRFVIPATATATAEYLLHDAGATVAVLGGGYALVFAFDDLTRRNFLNQDLSRKLVHILSGLLFLVSWPIFSRGQHEGNWVPLPGERAGSGRAAPAVWAPSNTTKARYFAAFVPLMNCLRLLVNGLSLASDEGLIKSVTRKGDPRELLKGPLYYVVILMLCALVFWRESPIGVVALAMMSGGDGVADIIGRRYGSMKIPYNQKKSWAGSISMLVFGFLVSIGMLYYYSNLGLVQLDWVSTVPRVAFVSLVATVVESLPITEVVDDNISVPLATMAVAFLAFQH